MFIYKTQEELSKMTPQEVDTYATAMKAHEADLRKKELEEATKGLVSNDTLTAELGKATKAISDLEELINQLKEAQMNGNVENKKGYFVEFVEKNLESKPDSTPSYSAKTQIKAHDLLVTKDPALMTTANVLPNVSNGFNQLFGNFIDSTIYATPKPDTFILPLVDVQTQAGTESIWYVDRINEEGDAEFIGEGDAKPLADAEWQERKAPIKEVAVFWKMSKRLAQNAPSVVSDFRIHANQLVEQKLDDEVLAGDNIGDNLAGVAELASAFVVPTQLAGYYQDANIYDVIMAMATKVRLGNYKGQITAVLNTVWKAKMQGIKNVDGDYIVPPFVTQDGNNVGEVRVVFTNKMDDEAILVGDLKNFKVVISQNIEYYEGYENDDFRKNLMSKKLEAFLGTYLPSSLTNSIIYDDIATVLTAIEQAEPSV